METIKWVCRWFTWLLITWVDVLENGENFGPHAQVTLSLTLSFSTAVVVVPFFGILAWDIDAPSKVVIGGLAILIYLLIGLVFYFANPNSNCPTKWQKNGPW
jgi:hypothetical protein